ncbi:hypothetical protein [Ligilactobacillus acidipiscis]|uniref:Uncharacterized protein n=1 Tax=Ligilactobacillus acidipiscis TaxID=89059 RepID=A0A0R2KHE3_9LACO|nr:hypothetical protein [Ligilactobacillus acidipiscis]KRN87270.1 hypothetical protein IV43_GL001568 [Ligilactobacillus acidipiscis]SFV39479.1 hypothetical protein LAC1533_0059 [Ligilactobacillus acidipiscis]
MKASELKELTKKYDNGELRTLVKELYKKIPKKIREEKDIDQLITDLPGTLQARKTAKKAQNTVTDFPAFKAEIEKFIDHAEQQDYFLYRPNRHIVKRERSKWRFIVKRYVKQIQTIPVNDKNGREATELLKKLYELMCHACEVYLFNTDDPFASIGINQTAFYELVVQRFFAQGITSESIVNAISLYLDNENDVDTSKIWLEESLEENLKTPAMKEMAIQQAQKLLTKNAHRTTQEWSEISSEDAFTKYEQEAVNNELTEFIFLSKLYLSEYEEGIEFFKQNYQDSAAAKLDVLLDWLQSFELKHEWIVEYEKAIKKGIEPSDRSQNSYDVYKNEPNQGLDNIYQDEIKRF